MAFSRIQRNTLLGLGASLLLSIVKLTAGLVGHSSALVADAIESFADTIGSLLVWQALRLSSRPPTERHPYGFGKAEALAALAIGLMLLLAAVTIVWQAFHEILIPHQAPRPWTLFVLVAVIGLKEFLFRVVIQGAIDFGSDAAKADAWHHRSDAITSLAAFLGVLIAIWGPAWFGIPQLVLADEVAAILASGVILLTAFHLMRPAFRELLDATCNDIEDLIRESGHQIQGVVEIEKVYVRKSGPGYHADMHLHVDPELSVRDAHVIAGKVKSHLKSTIPHLMGVLIHVEPAAHPSTPTLKVAAEPDRMRTEGIND